MAWLLGVIVVAIVAGILLFGDVSSEDASGRLNRVMETNDRHRVGDDVSVYEVDDERRNMEDVEVREVNEEDEYIGEIDPASNGQNNEGDDYIDCTNQCKSEFNSCLPGPGLPTETVNAIQDSCEADKSSCLADCETNFGTNS